MASSLTIRRPVPQLPDWVIEKDGKVVGTIRRRGNRHTGIGFIVHLRGANLAGQFTPGKKSFRTLATAKEAVAQAEDGTAERERYDHKYEPDAYGVCRRCGDERHPGPG